DSDPARVQVTKSRLPIPTIPRCGWRLPRPHAASAPGTVAPAAARAHGCREAGNYLKHRACTHCASGFGLWSAAIWSGGTGGWSRCVAASRIGWVAIACRAGVAGSGRVTSDRRLAGLGLWRLWAGAGLTPWWLVRLTKVVRSSPGPAVPGAGFAADALDHLPDVPHVRGGAWVAGEHEPGVLPAL